MGKHATLRSLIEDLKRNPPTPSEDEDEDDEED